MASSPVGSILGLFPFIEPTLNSPSFPFFKVSLRAHDCKISRIAGQVEKIENWDNLPGKPF